MDEARAFRQSPPEQGWDGFDESSRKQPLLPSSRKHGAASRKTREGPSMLKTPRALKPRSSTEGRRV